MPSPRTLWFLLDIYFDAYRTNETELYLKTKELSSDLNIGINCIRTRRHAFGISVLTFIGAAIGAYFIEKVLDDIKLYEKFKNYLVRVSGISEKGKETKLSIIPPRTAEHKQILEIVITAHSDDDMLKIIDELRNCDLLKTEIPKFKSDYINYSLVQYHAYIKNDIVEILRTKTLSIL